MMRCRRRKTRDQKWEYKNGKYQPMISEENVVKEIIDRLWYQAKIKMWRIRERIPGQGIPSTAGIPDLIGWVSPSVYSPSGIYGQPLLKATPLFIEVKRPGGKHRYSQEAFIAEAKAGGCIAFFAEKFNDVIVELAKYGIPLNEN